MRFIKRLLMYIVLFFVLLIVGAQVLFHLYTFNPPTPGYPLDSSIIQIKLQNNNTVAATALAGATDYSSIVAIGAGAIRTTKMPTALSSP